MLKIVKTSLVIAASTLAFSNAAQADVNEALANICTIVQADDKGELRKKMRRVQSDFKLKLHDYYSGISCNGNSLIPYCYRKQRGRCRYTFGEENAKS